MVRPDERIYDQMRKEDAKGTDPMYREKGYQKKERKMKKRPRNTIGIARGDILPHHGPPTPNGELVEMLRVLTNFLMDSWRQ